jgi:hypothetical protein
MRKGTLLGIAIGISYAFVYFGRDLMASYGYRDSVVFVGAAVIAPLILALVYPLNQRLLQWRKECGRDIEEEEKYESEYGMISLSRRDDEK